MEKGSVSYLNRKTCEVTRDKAVFRRWIRHGYAVEVWRNDRVIMVFNDLGLYM